MPNLCDEDGDGAITFKECCRACGKIYLLLVCLLFFLLSILQLVIATTAQVSSPPGIGANAIYITYGIGGGVLVSCVVGVVGIVKMNRCWLAVFTFLMVILAMGMLIVSIMMTTFTSQSLDADPGTQGYIEIENYLNCTYQGCCSRCTSDTVGRMLSSKHCRVRNIPCDSRNANLNPVLCTFVEHESHNLAENCAKEPSEFRFAMLKEVKSNFNTMVIVLLSSFGVIILSLILSLYFTAAKKVVHVMDMFDDEHHTTSTSTYVQEG